MEYFVVLVQVGLIPGGLLHARVSRYTADDLRQDVMSGLVVGVIALSLSMALGIASESTPAIGWVGQGL
jgi:MFS superfamily sulfate permease-like transporter